MVMLLRKLVLFLVGMAVLSGCYESQSTAVLSDGGESVPPSGSSRDDSSDASNSGLGIRSIGLTESGGSIVMVMGGGFIEGSHSQFFIDADDNPGTGYADGPVRGADYLIEDAIVYRYPEGANGWRWENIASATSRRNDAHRIRVVIPREVLSLGRHGAYGARVMSPDWSQSAVYARMEPYTLADSGAGRYGRTLYVDVRHGNDSNEGSLDRPLQHVQRAIDLAGPGDRVFLKKGLYFEAVHITRSGVSGMPITIEGEVDRSGQPLAHIHGGTKISQRWISAQGERLDGVELGKGVYKISGLQGGTYAMTLFDNGVFKDVPRVDLDTVPYDTTHVSYYPHHKRVDVFNISSDQRVKMYFPDRETTVRYWDGIEAVYTQVGDTLYIRFRDYRNPNELDLYRAGGERQNGAASRESKLRHEVRQSATFRIGNASYIHLKNLKIDGAQNGVLIVGQQAHHNQVEKCDIVNGQHRVLIAKGAHDNLITRNDLHMVLLSRYRPMAWYDAWRLDHTHVGEENYPYIVAQHYYEAYKHEIGVDTSAPQDDTGVFLLAAGGNNDISHNEIHDTLAGVFGDAIGDVRIHDNYFHHISGTSVGRGHGQENDNGYVYGNNFINVHIALRYNPNSEQGARENLWFYDNLVYNPLGLGVGIYPTMENDYDTSQTRLFFYHNTIVGVGNDDLDRISENNEIVFVNNLYYRSRLSFWASPFAHIYYNWFGTLNRIDQVETRFGKNNIEADGSIPFTPAAFDNDRAPFVLNADSPARGAGLDLSEPFTIDGVNYEPLPGVPSGYSHDMGIISR